jgi:hypothetical protein
MSDLRYRSLLVICVLGVFNFIVFSIVAIVIGGDAVNGKIVGGHFYLANHGKLTEVSEAVFTYSLWHVRSLFVTHPLAMLTGYLAKTEQKARKLRHSSDSDQTRTLQNST